MKGFQVFDSGSSCSNEECWEIDEKGGKIKVSQEKSVKMSEPTELESKVQHPTLNVKVLTYILIIL